MYIQWLGFLKGFTCTSPETFVSTSTQPVFLFLHFELMHLWNLNKKFVSIYFQESKDRIIQQLAKELEHQDRLCQHYRRQLFSLLETVDEQTKCLSTKVKLVVNTVKKLENEVQKPLI